MPGDSSSSSSSKKKISKENVFELMRRATNKNKITDRQIWEEVAHFLEKYEKENIGNLAALINTWAGNIKPEKKQGFVY